MRRTLVALVALLMVFAAAPLARAGSGEDVAVPCSTPTQGSDEPAWLVNALAQWQLEEVGLLVQEVDGIVQQTMDDEARRAVVLYDPLQMDHDEAQQAVAAALVRGEDNLSTWRADHERWMEAVAAGRGSLTPEERATLAQQSGQPYPNPDEALEVEVRPACGDPEHLRTIRAALIEMMETGTSPGGMTVSVDFTVGAVKVGLPDNDAGGRLGGLLRDRYGDAVRVHKSGGIMPVQGGRLGDTSPHYGGARINNSGGTCTSGYAADLNGGRWMIGAAHCGQKTSYGESWKSGSTFYATGLYWYLAPWDFFVMGDGTHQYSRIIYTNPSSPGTRLQTAKGGNAVGTYVCVSGASTGNVCSVRVFETGFVGEKEDGSWWWQDLVRARNVHGNFTAQGGDSGAPVWSSSGVGWNEARIHGVLVAGNPDDASEVYYFSQSRVQQQTGATVATACCNNDSW